MLTVLEKNIHGQEVIYEAERVILSLITNQHGTVIDGKPLGSKYIEVENPRSSYEGKTTYIYYGNVFVMNEHGKTVASYHLGSPTK